MLRASVLLGNTPTPTWSRGLVFLPSLCVWVCLPRLISSSFTNHLRPSEVTLASSCLRGREPRSPEFPPPGDLAPRDPGCAGSTSRITGWTCPRGSHTTGAVTQLPCGRLRQHPLHGWISRFALVRTRALGKSENDPNQAVALALPGPDNQTRPGNPQPSSGGGGGALEVSVPRAKGRRWLHPWVVTSPACNCSPETVSVQIALYTFRLATTHTQNSLFTH